MNIELDKEKVDTVSETKLLGTIITNDLRWNRNTAKIVREGNLRMQFLHKSAKFTNNIIDLKQIYISQVRSKLEQSAVVWHSSLTHKNENDIERIQKSALKVILKSDYTSYQNALEIMRMQSLKDRRELLCLKFAKNCLKIDKFKKFFPLNSKSHIMPTRFSERYAAKKKASERYAKSALPNMIKLLNDYDRRKSDMLQSVSNFNVPMNYGSCASLSLC